MLTLRRSLTEIVHLLVVVEVTLIYLYILDLFDRSYLILIGGVVWYRVYELGFVARGLLLLVSLLLVALLVLYAYKGFGFEAGKAIRCALIVLSIVFFIPLVYWSLRMVGVRFCEYGLVRLFLSELDAWFFNLDLYLSLYPFILMAMLFSWLPLCIGSVFRVDLKVRVRVNHDVDSGDSRTNVLVVGLLLVLLLSVFMSVIPYLPTINPEFTPVSVDIRFYSMWVDEMLVRHPWRAVEYAFSGAGSGNRPLFLLFLYSLVKLGIPRELVLNFEPLFISPLFALAVYFTAKRLFESSLLGLAASLAATLGFNMTVGMMSGFFAAWAALALFYACITLTSGSRVRSIVGSILVSVLLLFVHPWTWGVLMAVLMVYLSSSALRSHKLDKRVLCVLIANFMADIIKTIFSPTSGGVESLTALAREEKAFGIRNVLVLASNLGTVSRTYVGGLFYNPIHLILSLVGLLTLLRKEDGLSKMVAIWVAVISLALPFASVGLISHLLFATPFPLLIAEGLRSTCRFLHKFGSVTPRLFQTFFILSSMTYTVRGLCNLI